MTRFEAGNIEASKSSLILPAEEVSPYLQTKVYRSSVEGLEDIECTKKIVDNLSEVSSILQEDSQNFSVSDQIMFENIERNSLKTKKKSSNLHSNEKLILKVDINPAFHKKNMKKTEEKRNFLNIYKSIDNPSLMDKRKADELKTPKNNIDSNIPKTSDNANNFLIEKNNTNNNDFKIQYNNNNDFNSKKQIEYHHVRTTNGSSQEIFYSNDYKLYLFKDRVQKAYSELEMAKSDKNKDNPLIFKEIFELVLENNKSSFNLDDHTSKMFTDLRNFYHKSLPKGSELNRSFLEKNRSSSANSVNDKKEVFTKPNIKAVTNKATNPPSNSSFIRTYTEKGFYDSVDKNKKGQLHYVKYRSINLQDGLAFNQQEKNTTQTNPTY